METKEKRGREKEGDLAAASSNGVFAILLKLVKHRMNIYSFTYRQPSYSTRNIRHYDRKRNGDRKLSKRVLGGIARPSKFAWNKAKAMALLSIASRST